ncbi:mercuric transport protein MerTP [Stygiobacter electus]|uniref:Mercuric transport protein MerT n=1 Tax=Stygiobacter electus TaxID=3032292 RepID=A0AAE3P3U5_9BACT|nr:mercuric transport protein MerTP [Stygiobacter electus]MDF1612683.1 mercuric transport protein MerTP [Stygiobacter electus]
METNKFFRNSAIVTALLASLCCITPVLAILGGLSGIASTFSFLEPLRPYFIAFTVIILGYAFYSAYKPKKKDEIECACEDNTSDKKVSLINSKKFLWIITVVSALLITFPYYSQAFFPNDTKNLIVVQSNNILKAKLEIEGMTCTSCEQSVDYALKSEKGVLNAESSYKTGIAYVEFNNTKVKPEQLKKAVENKVGYKVKKIQIINEKEN